MQKYILAILIAFASCSALAQARLTAAQLKPFEGYYRSSRNKDQIVHFVTEKDTLVAKPLWADLVVHMIPKTDLAFQSLEAIEGRPIDILFSRDSTGDVAAVDLGNTGVKWNREKNYKPTIKKEMAHTPGQLKPYEGIYRLDREGERFLQFYVKDNDLILKQIWDGTELPFHPENENDFFTDKIPIFSLKFTRDAQGNVSQVLAFGHDLWIKTKKPELSAADLEAASGKFQSKDDPDNQVTIAVKDKRLVVRQLWDNKEIVVDALADDYFFNPAKQYKLQLHRDGNGRINEVVLLETSTFERVGQ